MRNSNGSGTNGRCCFCGAEELGRSLLHTRVPEWAEVEPQEEKPTDQRFRWANTQSLESALHWLVGPP